MLMLIMDNLTSIFYDNIDTKDKDHFNIFKKVD